MVRSLDLRVVALPDGSLSTKVVADKAIVIFLKNISLNLDALPNEFLHTLQVGVIAEVKAREQRTLSLISEYRLLNNVHMFVEKSVALEAQKKVQAHNDQVAAMVVEACRTVPELHIPKEVPLEVNIRKMATSVRDAKTKVARDQFELNLKIIELELKS